MGIGEYISISLSVLTDLRVVAIAVATLLLWAILRYVGLVYGRRKGKRPLLRKNTPPKAAVNAPPSTDSNTAEQ